MGANQSSNATINTTTINNSELLLHYFPPDNEASPGFSSGSAGGGQSLAMTNSPLSSLSASPSLAITTAGAGSTAAIHGQQHKYSTLSSSPRSPKDLFVKRKSISTSGNSASGKTTASAGKDTVTDTSMDSSAVHLARGLPCRTSAILRGSFRRVKAPPPLHNAPLPPVIPDEKFHRLSNVSLGSSSGFGSSSGSSSQESTASSDSASSSTLSSAFPPSQPQTQTQQRSLDASNFLLLDQSSVARKARMNLRLNIVPGNPPDFNGGIAGTTTTVNGSYDNPYGSSTGRSNQARSPIASPLASPLYHPGSDSLRSPQSSCELSTAQLRRSETLGKSTFRPPFLSTTTTSSDRDRDVMMGNYDSLKSPTRSDYVELMCTTTTDSRHSRSSFSSFDGSTYSSSSFHNSPNGSSTHQQQPTLDVAAMFQAGMNDNEVLSAWLGSIGFTEYFPNFVQAGYDMASAARMTTEDLTAIGVTKPQHRKRIRAEIARLLPNVDMNFGCDLPDTAAQFLQAIGLSEYLSIFVGQNYMTWDKIMNLTWEDLEDFGVKKLGHLKKLTLAIKYFRALRRQTAQSIAMEEETRRFSNGSFMSQDSNLGSNLPDDDKSSASRSSLSSSRRLLERKAMQQQPILSTFQASPASPVKNPSVVDSPWRPRSALGRLPSPLAQTPESEELVLSWNGSNQKIDSPTAQPEPLGSLANGHSTLPRRKSVKSGAGKSIAKMMAQVFRSEKVSSAPSSPNRDQSDPSPVTNLHLSHPDSRHPASPSPTGRAPLLVSFAGNNAKLPPPAHRVSPSKSRHLASPDFNDMGSLSRFPPPPSPLLRDYPRDTDHETSAGTGADTDKTPTLSHRTFACQERPEQPRLPKSMSDFSARDAAFHRPSNHQPASMPFAQDNIGTIKQRAGRTVPSMMNSLVFHDPSLKAVGAAGAAVLTNGSDHSNEQVLDEITGMLASLSDELDVAMYQLENAAH